MLQNDEIKTVRGSIAGKPVTYETGRLAKQAGGAVLATMGGTVVLAAVTVSNSAKEGLDFFPLTVDYFEKMYAAGKIPGGFYKREGRPSCLLYTSDAADDLLCVDLGGRRIITKKNMAKHWRIRI